MVLHGPGAAGPSGLPGSIPGQGVCFSKLLKAKFFYFKLRSCSPMAKTARLHRANPGPIPGRTMFENRKD